MNAKHLTCIALSLCLFAVSPRVAGAADYAGKYEGSNLSVMLAAEGNAYGGEIRLGDQTFPVKAHEEADHLAGVFTARGGSYAFTATLQPDGLTLVTDGTTYVLHRQHAEPANPLAAAPPATPAPAAAAAAPSAADALASYTVVNNTEFGKALARQFASATTVRGALQSTFPDLARYFGARPTILGAYEDQKDHKAAGVSFSAQLNGTPVNGFVSAKLGEQGATVAVVYCRADAPKAEWTKLITPPAAPRTGGDAHGDGGDVRAEAAKIPLQTYVFPDNTGSVGVAEGWKTNAPTLGGAILIGPADQQIVIDASAEVIPPDSPAIRFQQQLANNARRFHQPPPPPLRMLVAAYDPDPAHALKNLSPALSQVSQRNGGPATAIEQIIQETKVPPLSPKGNAALILFDASRTTQRSTKHYRSLMAMEVYPIGQGAWGFLATQLIAPKETFQQDLPVMLAQSNSVKENAAGIQKKTQEAIAAQNARFAAMQAANKQVQDAFDARNRDVERNQLLTSRTNANFDETIRGYRTVEDTATGQKTSVDLGDVHNVVEKLNESDPGRYKEVPLRDELYPLPVQP